MASKTQDVGADKIASQKALSDVYKNVTMAKQSVKNLLPYVEDRALCKTLLNETEKYDDFCKTAEHIADKLEVEISPVSQTLLNMAKIGMKMKMLGDHSTENAVKMMLKGTFSGILDLYALIAHGQHLHDKVLLLAKDVLAYQEERIENLKTAL